MQQIALHDVMAGVWCAMSETWKIKPICSETLNGLSAERCVGGGGGV
jgi:hypothetical protein